MTLTEMVKSPIPNLLLPAGEVISIVGNAVGVIDGEDVIVGAGVILAVGEVGVEGVGVGVEVGAGVIEGEEVQAASKRHRKY